MCCVLFSSAMSSGVYDIPSEKHIREAAVSWHR